MKRLFWLLPALFLLSCTPYNDGPVISIRNPEKVIDGNWRVESYTVDGADSMWVIQDLHLDGKWDFHFIVHKPAPSYIDLSTFRFITIQNGNEYEYVGKWSAEEESEPLLRLWFETLRMDTTLHHFDMLRPDKPLLQKQMPLFFKPQPHTLVGWRITRLLGNKQIWLESNNDSQGKHYELRLKKY